LVAPLPAGVVVGVDGLEDLEWCEGVGDDARVAGVGDDARVVGVGSALVELLVPAHPVTARIATVARASRDNVTAGTVTPGT
jgi:hypothetical protein